MPLTLPLDLQSKNRALQDDKGNTIGTGTREVCEVLLYIITKTLSPTGSGRTKMPMPQRADVRAAIAI